jgi:hypothetical protein
LDRALATLRADRQIREPQSGLLSGGADSKSLSGLYTLIEEHLAFPFTTEVLGVAVSVKRVELTDDGIVAVCFAGRHRQRIPILDLPLPVSPPGGVEWIEAYRHWRRGRA